MSVAPNDPSNSGDSVTLRTRAQLSLHRRTYPLRILGMGLASLPMIAVMLELHAPWPSWTWMVMSCLVWPHLAALLSWRSRDPFRAEIRNFVIDSAIAGSWVPLIHFNLLPSALLLTVVSADKVNSGVRRLWLHSLPGMVAALLGAGVLTGFALQPSTSMFVVVSCLPIMIIHTLAVSISSYRLVRRVQSQNLKLEELSRVDALTGLFSRGHWEVKAELLQNRHDPARGPAMMVLDVDQFKDINDHYGHAIGDDVLRAIAELVRHHLPPDAYAGRLGGDEFALALPLPLGEAAKTAEAIRQAVQALAFANAPDLRCTISIGLAGPPQRQGDLRSWLEQADRALYRAKHEGRNRAMIA